MKIPRFTFWLSLLAVMLPASLRAQTARGLPPLRSYPYEDIGNVTAGVRLASDALGRITVTQAGVYLVYDGMNWADCTSPDDNNRNMIKAALAPDGVMFCSSAGSWGYFEHMSDGKVRVHPLTAEHSPPWAANTEFNQIVFTPRGVAFVSFSGLVFYDRTTRQHHFEAVSDLLSVFALGDAIYVSSDSHGLYRFDPPTGAFTPVRSAPAPAENFSIATPWDERRVLAVTKEGAAVLFDGAKIERWPTAIDALLRDGVSALRKLDGDHVALAVKGHGVYILDGQGRVLLALADTPYTAVSDLCSNEPGVLWIATPNGLSKVLYRSPLDVFDQKMGLRLRWPEVVSHRGGTFVMSDGRLYQPDEAAPGHMTPLRKVELPFDDYLTSSESTPHGLLLGSTKALYERRDDGKIRKILDGMIPLRIALADDRGDACFVICASEIAMLRWTGQEWQEFGQRIPGLGFPSTLVSAVPGSAWIELGLSRVGRIWFRDGQVRARVFDVFPGAEKSWVGIGAIGKKIVISISLSSGEQRLFFDEATDDFRPEPALAQVLAHDSMRSMRPRSDASGVIWMPYDYGLYRLVPEADGRYRTDVDSLRSLHDNFPVLQMLDNGEIWLRSERLLQRIDPRQTGTPLRTPRPILTWISDTRRNLDLYSALASAPDTALRTIPYRSNSLGFHFFPGSYWPLRSLSYQFKIEGYSDTWSAPTGQPALSLTNLREGNYRMTVRLLDVAGPVGETTSIAFTILPPFYRTWYAWLAYVALAGVTLAGGSRWMLRRAQTRNEQLALLVKERTGELDQVNSSLRVAAAESQQAAEAKGRFLANMSHEIRTPMNGVLGMIGELAHTQLDARQREMCRVVDGSAKSLLTIIDDILDFSKIEQGKLNIECVPLNLAQLVGDTVALFEPRAGEKGITLTTALPLELDAVYLGDPVRLRQVLSNLLGNAIKFTTRGGVAIKVVAASPDTFRFAVSDTGIGVSPEACARLFQPFEQADGSHTRIFGGTGLGLAISRELVELMHGEIGLDSEPGRGSTFWFQLKFAHAPEKALPAPATGRTLEVARSRPLRLLVVDDNPVNLMVARLLLQRLGHTVEVAEDGVIACEKISRQEYDGVLMDCQMPRLDGYAATLRIRSGELAGVNPRVPVIGLTACVMPADRARGLAAGMDDYIAKPFKPDEIERSFARLGLGANAPAAPVRPENTPEDRYDREQLALLAVTPAGHERPLAETLFAAFLKVTPAVFAEISASLQERRASDLGASAHRVAGSAASLGAKALRAAANEIEGAALAGEWERATRAFTTLESEWLYLQRNPGPWLSPHESSRR